ncbi:hypothetical protein HYPSUDRAFT_217954, partial [Hypholoma sublateritium FD-334 SS-4]
MFTTLAVTLWTTILIAYRIYSASHHILDRKKRHFYNILEIIIQSSFLYSLALVTEALIVAIASKELHSVAVSIASKYASGIIPVIT